MNKITSSDLRNIRIALEFIIKSMDEKTDGTDPIRTAIWRQRMIETYIKVGGNIKEIILKKLLE